MKIKILSPRTSENVILNSFSYDKVNILKVLFDMRLFQITLAVTSNKNFKFVMNVINLKF